MQTPSIPISRIVCAKLYNQLYDIVLKNLTLFPKATVLFLVLPQICYLSFNK